MNGSPLESGKHVCKEPSCQALLWTSAHSSGEHTTGLDPGRLTKAILQSCLSVGNSEVIVQGTKTTKRPLVPIPDLASSPPASQVRRFPEMPVDSVHFPPTPSSGNSCFPEPTLKSPDTPA